MITFTVNLKRQRCRFLLASSRILIESYAGGVPVGIELFGWSDEILAVQNLKLKDESDCIAPGTEPS